MIRSTVLALIALAFTQTTFQQQTLQLQECDVSLSMVDKRLKANVTEEYMFLVSGRPNYKVVRLRKRRLPMFVSPW